MKIIAFHLNPFKGRKSKIDKKKVQKPPKSKLKEPKAAKPKEAKPWYKSIKPPKVKLKKPDLKGISNKKKALMLGLATLMMLALFPLSSTGKSVVAAATKRDLPIYCVQKDSKVLSLSFDAAWGNEDTQQLIDILGTYDIKATFFVVGEWVDKYPESVLALHEAGHEIMNHSSDHAHFPKLSAEQMIADLNKCNEKIAAITGVTPTLFRPPYGDYNDQVVATARSIGMHTIQWDVDSLDWKDYTADQISKRVLDRVQAGSIVLFHNAAKHTPAALPTIIEGLIRQGYGFAPISKLILTENYEIDHSGKQCPAGTA